MATKLITLPSGLSGTIRNMKAKELSFLADPNNGKAGKGAKLKTHPLDPVYRGCWVQTTDHGPYDFSEADGPPWGKVVLADRFVALLHIRQLTWGDFAFRVWCSNGACERSKKGFIKSLDITELPTRDLPDETKAKVRSGDLEFPILIDGTPCKFEILTGSKEVNRPELSESLPSNQKMLAQVASRLTEIDGKRVSAESDAVLDWVGNLDLPVLFAATAEMERVDGGVETRVIVECPKCGLEFPRDVPFDDPGFLTPTQR